MKGGLLAHIYKGHGPHHKCSSHRGILMVATFAKYLHQALRPSIRDHFQIHSLPLQLGGKPGTPVTFAAHIVRGFLRWQSRKGASCCVLFSDISAAFYAAVRQLAAPVLLPDFEKLCAGLALSQDDLEELRLHVQRPCALAQDGASEWLQRVTAEIHSNTWMHVTGTQAEPLITSRGTRPGSAWADLTFAVILKRVLGHRDDLRRHSAMPSVPWDGLKNPFVAAAPSCSRDLPDVIWADDVASCMCCPSASQVEPQLMHGAGILADSFQSFGMTLNFGVRKTAAVVACRGQGTKEAKRSLFGRQSVSVLREHAPPEELPLPATYKHVGVVHDSEGSLCSEVSQRVAEAWRTFRQGRKKLFRCPEVDLSARVTLWRTMVLSRLFYGAGTWPTLKVRESQRVQAAILGMLRQIAVPHHSKEQRLHQSEVCAAAGYACPAVMLHVERLRYFRLMLRSAPEVLWALIRQDPTSLAHFQEAFFWLYSREACMRQMGAPDLHWDRWESFMCLQPRRFKAVLKRALKLDAVRQRCIAALCVLHRGLVDLQGRNLSPEEGPAIADLQEACPICRIAFETRVAWACHASRVHGYRRQSTKLASGRTCLSCGRLYAKASRLRRHLEAVPLCRAN